MVWMIRIPPREVPIPMVRAQRKTTQVGIIEVVCAPPKTKAKQKTPINFWPSLEPWLKAIKPADKICQRAKRRRERLGEVFQKTSCTPVAVNQPAIKPTTEEKPRPIRTFSQPSH